MSTVKEKSIDRASIRKEIRILIRARGHITDKVNDAQKELDDINQGLYDSYEQIGIKSYEYKKKKYQVQRQTYHKWDMDGLRKFLKNKFNKKILKKIIISETKTVTVEHIDDDAMYELIDSIKGKKAKGKLRDQLGKLVEVTEGKQFIRIYNS